MTFENTHNFSDLIIYRKYVTETKVYHSSCQFISESVIGLEIAMGNAKTNPMGIFVRLYKIWTLNINTRS